MENRQYQQSPHRRVSQDHSGDLANMPVKRRSLWPKIIAAVLVPTVIVGLVYVSFVLYFLSQITVNVFKPGGLARDENGRTNVVLLGQGDPGHAGDRLTDTMMLMSYDSEIKRIAQISVPRDLRVFLENVGYTKINAVNAYAGVDGVVDTVEETLGVPIHYYVKTDFTGLKKLVDAVGGVDVDVKERLLDTEYPCEDNQYAICGLDIEPGLQHMDGARALQYARCRKGTCGNDFGRAKRQQEILNLVRDKAVNWQTVLNPFKLMSIVEALSSSVKTDMSSWQLLQFALEWQDARLNDPVRLVLHAGEGGYLTGDPNGSSDLVPAAGDFDEIKARVQNIFSDPIRDTDLPSN